MRMAMIMNDEDALDSFVSCQSLHSCSGDAGDGQDGGVFFWLGFFGAVQEAVGMVMGGDMWGGASYLKVSCREGT